MSGSSAIRSSGNLHIDSFDSDKLNLIYINRQLLKSSTILLLGPRELDQVLDRKIAKKWLDEVRHLLGFLLFSGFYGRTPSRIE